MMGAETAINAVPVDFWYASTIILAGVLVWVITNFVAWLRKAVNELKDGVDALRLIVKSHEQTLKDHEDELNQLKGNTRRRRQ